MFTLYVLAPPFCPVWVVALSQNTSLKVCCGPIVSTSSPIDTFVCWISLEIGSSSLAIVMDHTKGNFQVFGSDAFVLRREIWVSFTSVTSF